ncbi:histidine--tRNA ligase, partial [Nocardia tengchongensis]|uniref:histidine--tRNA ligase n=1 Tax=Nocardia tengchongensis TaxID=2055889 RepID=UPI003673B724
TSLGDATRRPTYRERLQDFLSKRPHAEHPRRRALNNPLRVLDDKRPEVQEMTANAPLMIDHLSESAKAHFEQVLGHLDALGVPYVVNPRLVRGLDYYTKTTFEFVHDGLGAQSGIGGGGRYDGLMAELGGQALSGIGFGIGVDRTVLALEAEGKTAVDGPRVQVFGIPLGDVAKQRLVVLAAELRKAGIRTDLAYGGRGMKGAMKAADKSGAQLALVLGDREVADGEIGLKNLSTGEQRQIPLDEAVAQVAATLAGEQD